jgi:hypothetical protein
MEGINEIVWLGVDTLFPLISVPVKNTVFRLPGVRFGKFTPETPSHTDEFQIIGGLSTPLNVWV